jgi:putative transposase
MNRGNRREAIFRSDGDRLLFRELLHEVARSRRWTLHGYCLMPNHYHLLVEIPNADLSAGVQRLNGEYASWFNRCHGLAGHLFQGRFLSIVIKNDAQFLTTLRYMAQNPVRGGLCRAPSEWRWSSYRETVDGRLIPTARLVACLGGEPGRARALFRAFVEDVWDDTAV